MRTFHVEVTQLVEVTLDETKFDEAFLAEFRESFYPFMTVEDHAEHIGQLQARCMIDLEWNGKEFVEGYGPADEFSLRAKVIETDVELVRHHAGSR